MTNHNNWFWSRRSGDRAKAVVTLPTGDVVIREPTEGWSRAFYEVVVRRSLAVRGACPRTARMYPSTVLAVTPTQGVLPGWWPIHEIRRHFAPPRIVLSDGAPQVLEPSCQRI